MKKKLIFLLCVSLFLKFQAQEVNLPGGNATNLQNAMNSINNKGTIIINGNVSINFTITVPKDIRLKFVNNYRFIIQPQVHLQINGSIDAGYHQIFDVHSTAFLDGTPKIPHAVPQWWQPTTNSSDWRYAIQQAVNFYPRVYFPPGTYNVSNSVILKRRNSHYLYGEGNNSVIKTTTTNYIFKTDNNDMVIMDKGLTIHNLYFDGKYGIQLNHSQTQYVDSVTDHIHKVEISKCFFNSTNGGGTAIYFAKVFDSEIRFNEIVNYDIGVNLRGSDINSINNNRIKDFRKYAILDESYGSFGSQNEIAHNDILNYKGVANQGAFIKSFSRHVTIKNNYLENIPSVSKVRAMIDCSNYSATGSFGSNKSFPYYISISENRLDVFNTAADYTYLIQDDFASLFIDDQSNINNYPPSKFINSNGTIFSDFIKSRFNSFREKNINIQSATSFKEWNGFRTKILFDKGYGNSTIINSQHAANAITLTDPNTDTSLNINPLNFLLKGEANVPAYLIDLTQDLGINGEKELPKRVKIRVNFRVKPLSPPSSLNYTLYMRADNSSSQNVNYYYNGNMGSNTEFRTVEYIPNIDYVKNLYIQPGRCNLEVRSIEIIPTN